MRGCMVLKAEEKSAYRGLTVLMGISRCLWVVPVMNIFTSSTLLPARYANWSGSIRGSVALVMWVFMTHYMAFIIREVRATGLKSFRTFVVPFFRDENHS